MLFNGHPFHRGSGPLISILMPTRGRWREMAQALDSLYSLAYDKSLIEYCVKVDDDDIETIQALERLNRNPPPNFVLRVVISPRGNGYAINDYVAQLAKISRGDWLFNFCDDTVVTTEAWEQIVASSDFGSGPCGQPDGLYCFIPSIEGRPGSHEYFILRREVFEILGYIAPTPHIDTYVTSLMIFLNRVMYCNINLRHTYIEDKTAEDRKKTTKASVIELCLPSMLRQKIRDAEKLLQHMDIWWKDARFVRDEKNEAQSIVFYGP